MQSNKIDGLWRCLCPILATATVNSRRSFSKARLFDRITKIRRTGTAPYSTQRVVSKPCIPQRETIRSLGGAIPIVPRPTSLQRRDYNGSQIRHPRRLTRQAEIDALYEELHISNRRGKYEWTTSNIRKLVEDHHQEPSLRLYIPLILSNTDSRNGSAAAIEEILEEMGHENIIPDSATYHAILKVLTIHPDYVLRAEMLEAMRQRWFTLTDDGWHDLMAGLLRDRQIESAIETLYMLHDAGKRIESWLHDLFVYTLCDLDEFDEVLHVMRHRNDDGELEISPALWDNILDTASRSLHLETTAYAWRKGVESGFLDPSLGMCLNVINTAARHGDSRLALDVFRVLQERNYAPKIYHYEALIEAFASGSEPDLKRATNVILDMVNAGIPATAATVSPLYLLLKQYPRLLQQLINLLEDLQQAKRPVPPALINLLLEVYVFHNQPSAAMEFYKHRFTTFIPSGPSLQTIHILLKGCHLARRKDMAMSLAQELLRLKLRPTSETYNYLILACLHGQPEDGEHPDQGWDDAWRYYEETQQYDLRPSIDTFEALALKGCEMNDDRIWRLIPKDSKGKETDEEIVEIELRIRRIIGKHQDQGGKLEPRETRREKEVRAERTKTANEKAQAGTMMELAKKAMNLFV